MSAPSEDGGRIVLMQGGDRRSGACSEAKENAERLPDDMRVMMMIRSTHMEHGTIAYTRNWG